MRVGGELDVRPDVVAEWSQIVDDRVTYGVLVGHLPGVVDDEDDFEVEPAAELRDGNEGLG
jgi:hypothetical protein